MKQNEALALMKMGKNVFLTGEPGSGKTFLLNKYIAYLRELEVKIAVTASTGIAATHLQGVTIHSWSGIGVKDNIDEKELEEILKKQTIKRNYKKTKTLIIDEISMLHKHQLDMIDTISRHVLDPSKPFGGLQVILCGDFFQLPPVSSFLPSKEVEFAFEADAWKNGNFNVCYLEEQHRQGDDPLLTVLKDIRSGTTGEHTKIPLRTRYKKEPTGSTKATKLYARNINVDKINERELNNISADEKIFTMTATGIPALVNGLKKNCLAQEQLKLKKGAEVMFVKNHTSGQYVNGTRGIIIGFNKDEDWPIVKTNDNKTIVAHPEEWKYEDNEVVHARITQVPLRLAWAITIHKSQGMTLDAAEMDLGDVFELGMGYVALSRVRSLDGLKLMNLNELALKVHPKILQYDKALREKSADSVEYLKTLSEVKKTENQGKTFIDRFEAHAEEIENTQDKSEKRNIKKLKKNNELATYMITGQMLKENLSLEAIAEKRDISVNTILSHIEILHSLKQIDDTYLQSLKKMIPDTDFDIIYSELMTSEDGKLKTIYEKFKGKYSYKHIKIVRLFLNHI